MTIYYSTDKKTWFPARQYQVDTFNRANVLLKESEDLSRGIIIENNGIKIRVEQADAHILKFTQEDASTSGDCNSIVTYLAKNPVIKMYAYKKLVADYLGSKVDIPKGSSYYVQADKKDKPIIGWHGTYNPPLHMNGESMV